MRTLRLVGTGRIIAEDAAVPGLAEGEVLVRTSFASVCGSDLHNIFHSEHAHPEPPGYPGHESVGEVVESRSARFAPGDTVLAVPDITCFASFADYQAVPERFLLKIPATDPAMLVMAQQMGTVEFALKRFLRFEQQNDAALVIGAGSAGLHFVALLRLRGFRTVICSDVDETRLAVAAKMGATHVVNAAEARASDVALELTGGTGVSLVAEAAGLESTRADAVRAVADSGDLGFFGLPEGHGLTGFPFAEYFRKRATIHTTSLAQREAGLTSFATAVERIRTGEVDVTPMIGTPYPAERIVEAVHAAEDHAADSPKVVVDFR